MVRVRSNVRQFTGSGREAGGEGRVRDAEFRLRNELAAQGQRRELVAPLHFLAPDFCSLATSVAWFARLPVGHCRGRCWCELERLEFLWASLVASCERELVDRPSESFCRGRPGELDVPSFRAGCCRDRRRRRCCSHRRHNQPCDHSRRRRHRSRLRRSYGSKDCRRWPTTAASAGQAHRREDRRSLRIDCKDRSNTAGR